MPGDRRVKVLALTNEGERVQRALWERLMTDSPVAAGLDQEDQRVPLMMREHDRSPEDGSSQGYSMADVLAKPLFGLLVLAIALAKSRDEGYIEAGDTRSSQTVNGVPDRQDVRS